MSLRFPFFVDLSGKKAVVVGGGTVGLRRARVLRDFGAAVTVVAPSLGAPLEGVAHIARRYQAGDLAEAFLAVAATDDRAVNRAVWEEAQGRGVWVNVCDCQSECGFFFPAITFWADTIIPAWPDIRYTNTSSKIPINNSDLR